MKRSCLINSLKRATKIVLLFVVISVHGDFIGESVRHVVKSEFKPQIAKNKTYIPNAIVEQVTFTSVKNEQSSETLLRRGVLVTRKDAPATILVCHGYMCDKHDIAFIRMLFSNFNVMTFDFRAHGENIDAKQLCTFGKEEAYDVIAAVNYLKQRSDIAEKPLIGYGFSMGAVSAIEAQAKAGALFDAMVLDCPFDSSENLIKKGLDNLKVNIFGYEIPMPGRSLLQKYAYSPYVQSLLKVVLKTIAKMDASQTNTQILPIAPVESIEKISVPCYFITCKNDEKVSVDAVTSVYAGAKGFKRLWVTNGRRHFDSIFFNPEKYSHKINKFVEKVVNGSLNEDTPAKIVIDADQPINDVG